MAAALFALTGQVHLLGIPQQATKKLWHRDLILAVDEFAQPGEGVIKIQFSGEYLALVDEVQVGDTVTVKFLIRGVEYHREGIDKHLVVLMGQQLQIHSARRTPAKKSVSKSSCASTESPPQESVAKPPLIRLGSRMREAPAGEEPPF